MDLERNRPIADVVGFAISDAHRAFEQRVRDAVRDTVEPNAHDESDASALAMTRALGARGILDACVHLDVVAICLAREVVAAASGLADSMLALQGLGYGPIALAGTPEQKGRWESAVKSGTAIAAFALTEPEAGSDVASLETTAEPDGDGWVLRGRKCFISNAGLATFYVVFARTGGPGAGGISAFIVPGEHVRLVERYQLVAPHPCGEIAFDDVRLPAEALVGEPHQGFKLAMATLDHFRTTVGAAAIGMASRALSDATERARHRRQFGKAIGSFQQVGAMIADSWAELQAARLLVYRAARAHEGSEPDAAMYSSAAKMLATEAAQRIIDRAVQVHGGAGVRQGSAVERLYREIRALRIYEGTTEIQRVVLSRGLLGKLA